MNTQAKKTKNKKSHIFLKIFSLVLTIALIALAVYLGDYYKADDDAIAAFLPDDATISEDNGMIILEPDNPVAGLIFYPGGKVEYTAYIPLMHACYERGIMCVLVEMPFNLAVFDVSAADGIKEQFPHIENWYIGGHSLGGSMAAAYLSDHSGSFEGLVLLGSYSTQDLSKSGLSVLSVYGTNDNVMNKEKYDSSKSNLPSNFTEVIIEGGCHSYFGMYGKQDGDGSPEISNSEQIYITADAILDFVSFN